ncbi:glycine betaine ABC transporter substrate-binding protein [Halobacillus litoralis]|uniref:glycine betaine ABC transporter substrate-binding protein n=1 Tax=Halobacillus litoralis TaxID=45668 RepID=UPI001CD324C8|nr:glycine betaine ABC transporter substrate-binding protein [Halobacillus litoralis]MCA1024048.1 glycine betaine ABC transporter substrate-binding protein [Halobacillus litoralis]
MRQWKKWLPAFLMAGLIILTACGESTEEGSGDQQSAEESDTIHIGMNNWAENVAVSNMWKLILEDQGYTVELEQVEKGFLYEALASGDLDIGTEIWLPNTDQPFYEKYKDEIDWRETWYEGTELGLAVPAYMEDINTIEDLKDAEQFSDNQIVGISAGASIMNLTEEAIEEYDLDYSLLSSGEPTMITELKNAIADEEPIVATLWKPHWVFAEMDVKLLEDTKNVYGDSENISYAARLGLKEDHPEVVKWWDSFELDDNQLGSLMASINEADSEEEGARQWLDEHQDLVDEWTTES